MEEKYRKIILTIELKQKNKLINLENTIFQLIKFKKI